MFKKIHIIFILLLISFLFSPLAKVKAQESLIFGQQHSYSVFVKSNKEAFVFGRLVLINSEDSNLTKSSFRLSNAKASEMSIYQVILPQECAQYDYSRVGSDKCLRYKNPEYTNDNNYGNNYNYDTKNESIEYYKINYQESNGNYTFDLAKPVEAHQSTALVVTYATKDYVHELLGRYSFNFETLAVNQRVTKSKVSVTAETGYKLKDAQPKQRDDYRRPIYPIGLQSGTALQESISNPDIDKLYSHIGNDGEINMAFDNITPNETASVKGMFADSWWKLYLFEIIFVVLGLAGASFFIIFLSKRYSKQHSNKSTEDGVDSKVEPNKEQLPKRPILLTPYYWVVSLASVVAVGMLSVFVIKLDDAIQYSGFLSDSSTLVKIFILIIIILLYVLFIVGPLILTSIKYKWKGVGFILLFQLFWCFVLVSTLIMINL